MDKRKTTTAKQNALAGAIKRWPASRDELERMVRARLKIYKRELLKLREREDDPKEWAEDVEELMRSLAPIAPVFVEWCILNKRWQSRTKSRSALEHFSKLAASKEEQSALEELRRAYLPERKPPTRRTFVLHRVATAMQNWAKEINRKCGKEVFKRNRPVSKNEVIGHLTSVLLDVPGERLSSAAISRALRGHSLHQKYCRE